MLPPVLIEVVNLSFWPGFPWAAIAPFYDVWQPMSYWSFRSSSSGYGDGYTYNEESIRRLRANLGEPDAIVHAIGGIGGVDGIDDPANPEEPLASIEELRAIRRFTRRHGIDRRLDLRLGHARRRRRPNSIGRTVRYRVMRSAGVA